MAFPNSSFWPVLYEPKWVMLLPRQTNYISFTKVTPEADMGIKAKIIIAARARGISFKSFFILLLFLVLALSILIL